MGKFLSRLGAAKDLQQALATAKQSFTELNSNTDSVINEFARGVREGYSDQLN